MVIEDLSGRNLGPYHLQSLLGHGGMGAVYRAYHTQHNREVALKVLPSLLANEADYQERFRREIEISMQLEHVHIVPVYDFGIINNISYVAMRLLSSGTLAERLRLRFESNPPPLPLPTIAKLLEQLGGALDYAHQRGVIHRDIKPGNIMFDNVDNPFLVDFGIAKLLHAATSLTEVGELVGTPAYMAPEQWSSQPSTPATDQYAMAILIYALVTNRQPFEAPTPYGYMHLHLERKATPPESHRPDLPPSIGRVLAKAMAKNPEDRFQTMGEFSASFWAATQGQEVRITPPPPPPQHANRGGGSAKSGGIVSAIGGWWVIGGSILLLILLGILALILLLGGRKDDDGLATRVAVTSDLSQTADITDNDQVSTEVALAQTQQFETQAAIALTLTLDLDEFMSPDVSALAIGTLTQVPTATVPPSTDTPTPLLTATSTQIPSPTATIPPSTTPTPSLLADDVIPTPLGGGQGEVVFASLEDQYWVLYRIDPAGSDPIPLTDNQVNSLDPVWSPDGENILYATDEDGDWEIFIMDPDGTTTNLTEHDATDQHPRWSPDGSRIVFWSDRDEGYQNIFVMDSDGSNPVNLTPGEWNDWSPSWSPDGTQIAFRSERDGNWEIYLINVDDPELLVRLTTNDAYDDRPVWSPDGKQIVFHTTMGAEDPALGNDWQIFTMNIDGSEQQPLINLADSTMNADPFWSTDGTYLLFSSNATGLPNNIYRYNFTTGDSEQLSSDDSKIHRFPAWQP